jgi:hypothetical protein
MNKAYEHKKIALRRMREKYIEIYKLVGRKHKHNDGVCRVVRHPPNRSAIKAKKKI